jgi:WXXGXW repeat (2 copies)
MRYRFLRRLIPALALALAALPAIASAGVFVGVSVNLAPPALPVYVQPPCPQPGYMWTPGYWAWNDGAYYWVPGTWVLPPDVGLLWTPGYWGWDEGVYLWHAGYWGPQVGFYGGVHYGFGYDGVGFDGGYWRGRDFFYNRAVVRVGPAFVSHAYYHPGVYHTAYEHVSFNGGPGGVRARPTRQQMVAEHEHHFALTGLQERQQRMAFADRSLRADYNHGRPPVAATARPGAFHGSGAFAARAAGGRYTPSHGAAPMRSDRPSWANGQNRGGHERGARPMERPQTRAQPQYRQNLRPQQNFRAQGNFRPPQGRAAAARGPAHAPQRGGQRGGQKGQRPPENRGGGHGR